MQNCNHQIKDINTYILYVLYFLINALFITKYLMRISLSVTLLVLSAYLLAGLLLPRLAARVGHVGSRSLWFAIDCRAVPSSSTVSAVPSWPRPGIVQTGIEPT